MMSRSGRRLACSFSDRRKTAKTFQRLYSQMYFHSHEPGLDLIHCSISSMTTHIAASPPVHSLHIAA